MVLYSCENEDKVEIETGSFTDTRDNHQYKWVKIGRQIWMAENLNYETESGSWIYNNNTDNSETYGRLYDWATACKVCPDGWHLPKEFEYGFLIKDLGGDSIAGRKRKEYGTEHWYYPNDKTTNASGFTALPGGYFNSIEQTFKYMGYKGYWWTMSKSDFEPDPVEYAYSFQMYNKYCKIYRTGLHMNCGASIRCVKD